MVALVIKVWDLHIYEQFPSLLCRRTWNWTGKSGHPQHLMARPLFSDGV